jgi:pimeloyl-ACP methyl ester carboxylesterase
MVDIEHRFVIARGVRHHVAEAGAGSPLVLLHGWPEFWAAWEPIFARLANRYRLIAPDFRGFGESENPHPTPTDTVNAASLAEDIIALLDAMDIDRCGLVGHDAGSNVMQILGAIRCNWTAHRAAFSNRSRSPGDRRSERDPQHQAAALGDRCPGARCRGDLAHG